MLFKTVKMTEYKMSFRMDMTSRSVFKVCSCLHSHKNTIKRSVHLDVIINQSTSSVSCLNLTCVHSAHAHIWGHGLSQCTEAGHKAA